MFPRPVSAFRCILVLTREIGLVNLLSIFSANALTKSEAKHIVPAHGTLTVERSDLSNLTYKYMIQNMSRVVRKPAFCICENKDADQLRGNREADQRLCFRYTDSTIHLLPKYEISSLLPSSVAVQPGLCRTWSETPKTGFLTTRLK